MAGRGRACCLPLLHSAATLLPPLTCACFVTHCLLPHFCLPTCLHPPPFYRPLASAPHRLHLTTFHHLTFPAAETWRTNLFPLFELLLGAAAAMRSSSVNIRRTAANQHLDTAGARLRLSCILRAPPYSHNVQRSAAAGHLLLSVPNFRAGLHSQHCRRCYSTTGHLSWTCATAVLLAHGHSIGRPADAVTRRQYNRRNAAGAGYGCGNYNAFGG